MIAPIPGRNPSLQTRSRDIHPSLTMAIRPSRIPGSLSPSASRSSGAALIITLSILVLVTALVVTLFLTVSNERTESAAVANQGDAQRLADAVTGLVKSTITQATAGYKTNSGGTAFDTNSPVAWASQPGMIRTWDTTGQAYQFYRLYSSTNTIVTTDTNALSGDYTALTNWKSGAPASSGSYNALWCDLNSPASNTTGGLTYPVVTPPADTNSGSGSANIDTTNGVPTSVPGVVTTTQNGVQGFSVTSSPGYAGSTPGPTNNPAPMPVGWLYVLQDGSICTPASGSTAATAIITGASSSNPIVGRIAYWTDDETCKVNINTASEGVYWDKPLTATWEDSGWRNTDVSGTNGYSLLVPVQNEFQRLAGHPSFTSLSAIFGGWLPRPDIGLTNSGTNAASAYSGGSYTDNILPYYNLAIRIGDGGTKGGTRVIIDNTNTGNTITLDSDRLYATPDEFFYGTTNAVGPRAANNAALTNSTISRTRFFITASSKAPETTLFEQPRISMWPLDKTNATWNAKDQLFAFASTLSLSNGSVPYYFQRASEYTDDTSPGSSQSTTNDITLAANANLLAYLNSSLSRPVPGFGASMSSKYQSNSLQQIEMEIFDTCRSLINITSRNLTNVANPNGYSYVPYPTSVLDGHQVVGVGGVVPALGTIGGVTVKGLGRFPTIGEVQIVFMATSMADFTRPYPTVTKIFTFTNNSKTNITYNSNWADAAYNTNYFSYASNPPTDITNVTITNGLTVVTNTSAKMYADYTPRWNSTNSTYPILGVPLAYNTNYVQTNLLGITNAVISIANTNTAGDNLPDIMPLFRTAGDIGNPTNFFIDPSTGWINNLNGSFYFTNNVVAGSPQTTGVRAFLLIHPIIPAPGNPVMSPAVRYQVGGLDSFAITNSAGVSTPLGFPASNSAVVINRGVLYPFKGTGCLVNPDHGVFGELCYNDPGGTAYGKTSGICNGITTTPNLNDSKVGIFPLVGTNVPVPAAWPSRYGRLTNAPLSTNKVTNIFPVTNIIGAAAAANYYAGNMMDLRGSGYTNYSTMAFGGGTLTISIYPGSGNAVTNLIQTVRISFPPATLPVPFLYPLCLTNTNIGDLDTDDFWTNDVTNTAIAYNNTNGLFFSGGIIANGVTNDARVFNQRMTNVSSRTGANGYYGGFSTAPGSWRPESIIRRGDVVRSVYLDPRGPSKGDIRIIAGLTDVATNFFTSFTNYGNSSCLQAAGAGFHMIDSTRAALLYGNAWVSNNPTSFWCPWSPQLTNANGQLINPALNYYNPNSGNRGHAVNPIVPFGLLVASNFAGPGDWNTGIGSMFDGAYINSADQGFAHTNPSANPYFTVNNSDPTALDATTSFSPSRQVVSPVLFGSLPSGITPTTPTNSEPWRTLLFCPNPPAGNSHSGFGTGVGAGPNARAPFTKLPDHLFLDYFWMPVVEPYAISEAFTTAGKVNLNFQIAPFSHINRSTGLYAVLKAMKMPALHNSLGGYPAPTAINYKPDNWSAGSQITNSCRFNIDVEAVVAGMNATRFGAGDIYHSASELCSIFLVPSRQPGDTSTINATPDTPSSPPLPGPGLANATNRYNAVTNVSTGWWSNFQLTGDNARETPYDQIYSRITTKSNVYTIHMRVQALKQLSNRADWTKWNEATDQVLSEYRGAATIERYLDPNDTTIPDFTQSANFSKNLAPYYRWRTVSEKQFVP